MKKTTTLIFVKYALKVECYSLNLALPWPPTDVVGREFSEVALRNSFVENFASKTHLMTFKLRNGSDGGECEAVEEPNSCSSHAENVGALSWMLASCWHGPQYLLIVIVQMSGLHWGVDSSLCGEFTSLSGQGYIHFLHFLHSDCLN